MYTTRVRLKLYKRFQLFLTISFLHLWFLRKPVITRPFSLMQFSQRAIKMFIRMMKYVATTIILTLSVGRYNSYTSRYIYSDIII